MSQKSDWGIGMDKPKIILRLSEMTLGHLRGMTLHERRSGGDLSHIDRSRTNQNRVLIGSGNPGDDARTAIKSIRLENLQNEIEALQGGGRKKAANERLLEGMRDPWTSKTKAPFREVFLTASPEFFREPGQGPGEWDTEKAEMFIARAHSFLKERFGCSLIALSVHLDEETPHLHGLVIPMTEKNSKSRGRQILVAPSSHPSLKSLGGKTGYERLQDAAGEAFADLGIERGEARAAELRRLEEEDDLAEFLGEKVERRAPARLAHIPPAALRQATREELIAARQHRRNAAEELKATARKAATAELALADARERDRLAQRRADEAGAYAQALTVGADAIISDELRYGAASEASPERLVFGPAAPQNADWRSRLVSVIKPARAALIRFAKVVGIIREREAAVARDEAQIAEKATLLERGLRAARVVAVQGGWSDGANDIVGALGVAQQKRIQRQNERQ